MPNKMLDELPVVVAAKYPVVILLILSLGAEIRFLWVLFPTIHALNRDCLGKVFGP